jgi:hypothetical protein
MPGLVPGFVFGVCSGEGKNTIFSQRCRMLKHYYEQWWAPSALALVVSLPLMAGQLANNRFYSAAILFVFFWGVGASFVQLFRKRWVRALGSLASLVMVFVLVAGVSAVQYRSGAPRTEQTQNEQRDWVVEYLTKHITACAVEGAAVSISSDGAVVSDDGSKSFRLQAGGTFRNLPDHHASLYYTLKEIGAGTIAVGYESRFDHRSFGKDLITIDSGVVELNCK